ncbi:hypothetical protein QUF58_02185 [Anaerolineales bacterium HSG24]|nr:hypothetical protein [Anaerolineales bacterium HSG24]
MSLFFAVRDVETDEPDQLCQRWLTCSKLNLSSQQGEQGHYTGQAEGAVPAELRGTLAHDMHIIRLRLYRTGEQPPKVWGELYWLLKQIIDQVWSASVTSGASGASRASGALGASEISDNQPAHPPRAITFLYQATIPNRSEPRNRQQWVTAPEGLNLTEQQAGQDDLTQFGWLWWKEEGKINLPTGQAVPHNTLAMLTPKERATWADEQFLQPLEQGFSRIALYLHKAEHHGRQYQAVGKDLNESRPALRQTTREAMRTTDDDQIFLERRELENMAKGLKLLLADIDSADNLRESLERNLHSFNDHVSRVGLDNDIYTKRSRQLQRQLEAIEKDLHYAATTRQNVQAILELQREVVNMRLDHANFLLGIALAVLAIVSVFNSFIDVWSLAVDGHPTLTLPPPEIRLPIAGLAGLSAYILLVGYGLPIRRYREVDDQHRLQFLLTALAMFVVSIGLAWWFTG